MKEITISYYGIAKIIRRYSFYIKTVHEMVITDFYYFDVERLMRETVAYRCLKFMNRFKENKSG